MNQCLKIKDFLRKSKFKDKNSYLFLIKFFQNNEYFTKNFRFKMMLLFQIYLSKTSVVNIKHRCIDSERSRSIIRLTSLARNSFKDKLSYGKINGFRKSS